MKGIGWKDVAEGVIVVLMALLAFFGREMYAKQNDLAAGQAALAMSVSERFHTIDVWKTEVNASRFTTSDWMRAKQDIDANVVSMDKRLQRTEDAFAEILKRLDRMESKIDKSQARQ